MCVHGHCNPGSDIEDSCSHSENMEGGANEHIFCWMSLINIIVKLGRFCIDVY